MAEQAQLDLELPAATAVAASPPAKASFGGFTRSQIVIGAIVLLLLIWAMWVTNAVVRPKQGTIVAARLSGIVGDYVEAQRFSGSPPERVKREMQAFMASLDKELQRRSAAGEVVLVGEAVLTRSVPDITDDLKKAVYASGVTQPKRLSLDELRAMQERSALGGPSALPPPSDDASATIDPIATARSLPHGQGVQSVPTVSSFGGSGDIDGQ